MIKKSFYTSAFLLFLASCSDPSETPKKELNIYTSRLVELIQPLVEAYQKEHKEVKINILYLGKSILQKLEQEGKLTEADLILVSDISKMQTLKEKHLTQPIEDSVIEKNIPESYRDKEGHWFGLTKRLRLIAYRKEEAVKKKITGYESFASQDFKGRVCTRSMSHPYNISMVAAYMIDHGEAKTKQWLTQFKDNLALSPSGNDRGQMKLLAANQCDIAPINHYYYGKIQQDPTYKHVVDKVDIFPIQDMQGGAYPNISGIMLSKYSKKKETSIDFIQFLSGVKGQTIFQDVDFEIAVNPTLPLRNKIISKGADNIKNIPLSNIIENHVKAYELVQTIDFDK